MKYKTPEALEMAVAAAARASEMDTGRAVESFYFHRLLCRVFSNQESPFLLKGGHSMLARTLDARATRDIDLLAKGLSLDAALDELRALASIDLEDFVTFEYIDAKLIKSADRYRSGLRVSFAPLLGGKKKRTVSIDLVVDEIPCDSVEVLTPADRIDVEGIKVFDYRIYPMINSVADKLCAIFELHDGRPSSRVKDLVDLLVYASLTDYNGKELHDRIHLEARARKIELPRRFSVPEGWHHYYAKNYQKIVAQTRLPAELADLLCGEQEAAKFLDPVLDGSAINMCWICLGAIWTQLPDCSS